ncbi:EamA family transporter [Actinoplanes sp. NPDC051851]|uniref:DMT family transporter n=1 Tax=Actinoplanes sp. NPDC051851 TaxID=3154753 RepID=UPI003411FD45
MGPLLCLVSAAAFGATSIFGKLAYQAGVTPGTLLLVRFALAAAVLATLLRFQSRTRARLTPGAVLTALGLGAIGYALQAMLYFEALRRLDASLLSLILFTYPLMVTVGAVLLGRDRLTPRRVGALAAASGGTLLLLAGSTGAAFDLTGALLGFGCAVTYTVYILISDTAVRRIPPVQLSALIMTGATATMAVYAPLTGGADFGFRPEGWFWLACITLISTVVAMFTFLAGLHRTGPSTAAILSGSEPVIATILAATILGESLTPFQLAGGALVMVSAVVLQLRTRPADQPTATLSPTEQPTATLSPAEATTPAPEPPVTTGADPQDTTGRGDATGRTITITIPAVPPTTPATPKQVETT